MTASPLCEVGVTQPTLYAKDLVPIIVVIDADSAGI
jgi:hypothetical protein